MADLGFPRGGGANSPGGGGRQHTILPNFPKNCMKLKEFGPRGGGASKILQCRSATGTFGYGEFHIFIFKFLNVPAINVGCDQKFEAIANTFGLFSSIKNVSKRAARIGLLLSTAKPVLELSDQEIGKISVPNHKKSANP